MIIGRSGSGKSYFANSLGKALGREVTHLDKIFWTPDWEEAFPSHEAWETEIKKLAAGEMWILEGNFRRSIDMRLVRADTVVFFNFSPWFCLWCVYKRKFFPPKSRPDKHEGMPEKVTWALIKMIFKYPTKEILEKLKKAEGKKIFIVRSRKEAAAALQEIVSKK
jgi:adenylate kinase family enzyme